MALVFLKLFLFIQITFKAICKMLMSIEEEGELEMLQKDVSEVTEAMLAFPLKLPGTRFYRGLQVLLCDLFLVKEVLFRILTANMGEMHLVRQARRRIMNALEKKIGLRRKGLECHEDFLQSLLVMDESPNADPMADTHILDNILTLIIAGIYGALMLVPILIADFFLKTGMTLLIRH